MTLGALGVVVVLRRLGVASPWAYLPVGIVAWVATLEAGVHATLAGIGFTVSLFVAGLAFDDAALLAEAKLGILAGSVVSGAVGAALLARRRNAAALAPAGAGE